MHSTLRKTLSVMLVAVAMGALFSACSDDDSSTPPNNNNNNNNNGTVTDTIRPVVLVHGLYEAADVWNYYDQLYLMNNFTEAQVMAFDFVDYLASGSPNIEAMANQLKTQVEALSSSTGIGRVDVVSHGIGAMAVQYYLTKLGGVDKIAHSVMLAPILDPNLTLNGSLVPAPVKYMTIRSNGQDAFQNGNADAGVLQGAENVQIADLDHQEFMANSAAFLNTYRFCVGEQPTKTSVPHFQGGMAYPVQGKVITLFDNRPIADARVVYYDARYNPSDQSFGRQTGTTQQMTADANGNYTVTWTSNPFVQLEVLVRGDGNYFDMHLYRQHYRRATRFERIRVMPRDGGSPVLAAVRNAIPVSLNHSVVMLNSPNRALYQGRDYVRAVYAINRPETDSVVVTNAQTAPLPNAAFTGKSTSWMMMFDSGADQTTGTGPLNVPALNAPKINSFDLFFDTRETQITHAIEMNSVRQYIQNWKSGGGFGQTISGLTIVQFEDF